jgi:hypothetical protein
LCSTTSILTHGPRTKEELLDIARKMFPDKTWHGAQAKFRRKWLARFLSDNAERGLALKHVRVRESGGDAPGMVVIRALKTKSTLEKVISDHNIRRGGVRPCARPVPIRPSPSSRLCPPPAPACQLFSMDETGAECSTDFIGSSSMVTLPGAPSRQFASLSGHWTIATILCVPCVAPAP